MVVLDVIGLVASATLFGSMVFFSAVVAPFTFTKLDSATAGRFVRGMFPWYFLIIGSLSLVAAVSLVVLRPLEAALMALIAVGAVVSRQVLMPMINERRDRMLADDPTAERSFEHLHRLSVWINGAQLIAALAVLILIGAS